MKCLKNKIKLIMFNWDFLKKEAKQRTRDSKMVEQVKWGGGGGRKEMFYLTTHSKHFIYGYMASDIW